MKKHFKHILILPLMLTMILSIAAPLRAETSIDPLAKYKEYRIKALFLYNFANYVEWPNVAFESHDSPIKLCLFGNVPFGSFLSHVDGTLIRDRKLKIIRSSVLSEIESGCHTLFVGTDRLDLIEELFTNLNHVYVLSIGNVEGFIDKGGIINILRTQDMQQFDIDLAKAIQNGLLVDSDMLRLARIINK